MPKLASQSARTALENFAKKALPTNVPPPEDETEQGSGADMMDWSVFEQSTLLSGLLKNTPSPHLPERFS